MGTFQKNGLLCSFTVRVLPLLNNPDYILLESRG